MIMVTPITRRRNTQMRLRHLCRLSRHRHQRLNNSKITTKGRIHFLPFFFYATEAARSRIDWFMSGGPKDEVPQTKRLAPCCFAMGAVLV